ncbi:hypothetical protein RIF29_17853 [Crotalaria pallida]|uniref:Cytochrome P450 n=1 Tax=Crotalaria pallida TaxID=3830 RepID=A0AAN9FRM5_CROPI
MYKAEDEEDEEEEESPMVIPKIKLGKRVDRKSNLPPRPWRLPVIGSLHHLIGGLPFQRLRELSKEYGPIMLMQLGETLAIIVSSPEIAKEILKTNAETYAQRPTLLGAAGQHN